MTERKWGITLAAVAVGLAAAPYLYAWAAAGQHWVFTGMLYNPYDGYSYLAKMREGWAGHWRFTLPYTAHPGRGAYLFLFHLFLGHLARWLHLPLVWVYHLARLAGVATLVGALGRFFGAIFPENAFTRRTAWAWSVFSLGMGWMVLLWSPLPMDMWVADAYPLLSALTNAHFPWVLALLVWLLTPRKVRWWDALAAAALSILSPFGVVVAWTAWSVWLAWRYTIGNRWESDELWRWAVLTFAGAPYPLYAYWAIHHDPILAAWNAQNITLTPAWWSVALGFSPWLAVAGWGVVDYIWQKQRAPRSGKANSQRAVMGGKWQLLACWAAASLVLIAIPWQLQRRFLMGLMVPLAGLSAWALARWRPERRLAFLLWGLSSPTLIVLLLLPVWGAHIHNKALYMTTGEAQAMQWLAVHTPADAIVLAAPSTGRLIPAFSGRRVLFGHEMETVEAPRYRELTGDFFRRCLHGQQAWNFLRREGVTYIFLGPRERALGGLPIYLPPSSVAFRSQGVVIYRVP